LVFLFCLLSSSAFSAESDQDIIEEASKTINLELGGIVEQTTQIKFRPLKSTKSFYHVVPREYDSHYVAISAIKLSNNNQLKIERLSTVPTQFAAAIPKSHLNISDLIYYKISIDGADAGDSKIFSFEIKEAFKRRLEPFPAKITIKDEQYIKFEDSKFFLSLYSSKKQTTTFGIDNRALMYSPCF
jgi:hypothetical protein